MQISKLNLKCLNNKVLWDYNISSHELKLMFASRSMLHYSLYELNIGNRRLKNDDEYIYHN